MHVKGGQNEMSIGEIQEKWLSFANFGSKIGKILQNFAIFQ